jgi:hypothetical protein
MDETAALIFAIKNSKIKNENTGETPAPPVQG